MTTQDSQNQVAPINSEDQKKAKLFKFGELSKTAKDRVIAEELEFMNNNSPEQPEWTREDIIEFIKDDLSHYLYDEHGRIVRS